MSRVAVVVVTYNSEDVIESCLDACLKNAGEPAEVIVVDNASSDETCRRVLEFPAVRMIANAENRGFAAAVNQGVRATSAPHVLLLNPDAELLGGLAEMINDCEQGAAAVGGKLVDRTGRPQTGFALRRFPTSATLAFEALGWNRLWPGNPVNKHYRCQDWNPDSPAKVDQPAGAFLLFRRVAWLDVGGFDEQFHPLWFEDVDFCKRLKIKGLEIRYQPRATARHRGGHSIAKLNRECRNIYWYGSLLRYSCKHFRPIARTNVCLAVVAGAVLRSLAGIASERSLRPVFEFGKVIQLAMRCLVSPGARVNTKNA